MEHARIIRLGDTSVGTSNAPRVATFEEAFGEYSELFGKKARARREKRRDERVQRKVRRQERKAEKKIARQTRKDDVRKAKQERRSNRKQRRQQMRIDRRAQRKQARQAMRAEQQAARMARRMERKRQKQDREDLTADREMERELRMAQGQQELDSYLPQDDYGYEDDYADDAAYDEGYGEYGTGGGGSYDDGGYDDGGYDDGGYDPYDPYGDDDDYNPYADTGSQGGGYGGGYGGGGGYDADYGGGGGFSWDDADAEYGYGGGYDDGGYDDYGDYQDYGDGDYNYEDDYGWGDDGGGWNDDYGWGFDGEAGLVSDDDEQNEAQSIADKIEWNKKLIDKMAKSGGNAANAINERNNRITALKCQMRDYVCFDGDYFEDYEDEYFEGADGRSMRKSMKGAILRRMRKANKARGLARRKAGFGRGKALGLAKGRPMQRPTMVKGGIGAEIENNRIVIPATSAADGSMGATHIDLSESITPTPSEAYYDATGTGVTALDANQDYGYKPTEIMLGSDGSKSNMGMGRMGQVALGLGVGIAAIMILKSTKVL
jgi:type II secretory pathway pseudopilin PulG